MSTTLVGPTTTQQVNDSLYVGEGYLKTIQNAVDFAVNGGGGFKVVIPAGYSGSDTIAAVINGETTVYIVDERLPQTQIYSWSGTAYKPAGLHEMGNIQCDSVVTVNGTLDAAAANVDGSPVRTFANTAIGGGASFPPAGIGVSTGTAWEATSIDPAMVPLLDVANSFTALQSMTAGLDVTGGATLDTLTMTGRITLPGGSQVLANGGSIALDAYTPGNSVYLNWYGNGDGTIFCNGNGGNVGGCDKNGNLSASGTATFSGNLTVGSTTINSNGIIYSQSLFAFGPAVSSITQSNVQLGLASDHATPLMRFVNASAPANQKSALFSGLNTSFRMSFEDDGGTATTFFETFRSGGAPTTASLYTTGLNLGNGSETFVLQSAPGGAVMLNGTLFLNWTAGAGVYWGDGAGNQVASLLANGTFTAVTKNFRIVHPLDDTRHLTHSTLEGPEIAVFYRGEGVTDETAETTITLPDYFEALTRPEGRTVLLTALFEDSDDTEIGKLAAGRVKDGAFRVRSEYASQAFYWEVKAVRADVAPLEVVTDIPAPLDMQTQKPPAPKDKKKAK
jgi:hypothetical protein